MEANTEELAWSLQVERDANPSCAWKEIGPREEGREGAGSRKGGREGKSKGEMLGGRPQAESAGRM